MNMQRTAKEIGLFETAINLSRVCNSQDVIQKVGGSMPLPEADIECRTKQAAVWICGFGKKKYFFLTPEIALIDAMADKVSRESEIIIAVPCDMDHESKERLKNNLPRHMNVTLWEEPYFLQQFYPSNGIMIACGYMGSYYRPIVMSDTYRMVERYGGSFLGRRVFLPYREMEYATRYDGWMEVSQENLSDIWRYAV